MEGEYREFSCPICQRTYYTSSNYNRHLKVIHKATFSRIRPKAYSHDRYIFRCLEGCNTSYATTNRLIDHLVLDHHKDITPQKIEFLNFQDFNKWKAELEVENAVQYIQHNGKKVKKDSEIFHYKCNRSCVGRPDLKPRQEGRRARSSSVKTEHCCTSHIVVHIDRVSRRTHVKYIPFHYGHDKDFRLIKIPKLERIEIAKKLMQGVSISRLLEDIKCSNIESASRISRKDLHNIKKSFRINDFHTTLDQDDMKSLSLWVDELAKEEDLCVALWKQPGLLDQSYPLEEVQFDWLKEDMCLVLMSRGQGVLLEELASTSAVCLHSVRSDKLMIYLTVVAVVDEWGAWMPLATMWSSRVDFEVLESMMLVVRRMIGGGQGEVAPRCLVTDVSSAYFEVWGAALSPPKHHLFAPWHVTSAWKQALTKAIRCVDKRKNLLVMLEAIRDIETVSKFEKSMVEFVTMLDNASFNCFFTMAFAGEAEAWAKCYQSEDLRKELNILESGQRALAYEFHAGAKAGRVDVSVMAVHRLVQDKIRERLDRLSGGVPAILTMKSLHTAAEEATFTVTCTRLQSWTLVDPLTRQDCVVFQGNKCCDLACTDCNICYHSYICSCTQYNLHKTICKHIHYIHMYHSNTSVEEEVMKDDKEVPDESSNVETAMKPVRKLTVGKLKQRIAQVMSRALTILNTGNPSKQCLSTLLANSSPLVSLLRVNIGVRGKSHTKCNKDTVISHINCINDLCHRISDKNILKIAYKTAKCISWILRGNGMSVS